MLVAEITKKRLLKLSFTGGEVEKKNAEQNLRIKYTITAAITSKSLYDSWLLFFDEPNKHSNDTITNVRSFIVYLVTFHIVINRCHIMEALTVRY